MNVHRWLAALIVIATLAATGLAQRWLSYAQEVKPAPADCPQADGYAWSRFSDHPSGKVMWLQTKTQQLCGRASACAIRFEEVTVLVAQSPSWALSEGLRHHEECHDAWKHTDAPINGGAFH
jgi:hypothetical protein